MNPIEKIKQIQTIVGTSADGDWGAKSQAVLEKLKIEARDYIDMEEPLDLFDAKKNLIIKFLNAFETGTSGFRHDLITLLEDGDFGDGVRRLQITVSYGLTQASGTLGKFLTDYVNLDAKYSADFRPYLSQFSKPALAKNTTFINLLRTAARNDSAYTALLEQYYERFYYAPGLRWVRAQGFKDPLSAAVVIDSFLQSGGILGFLRNRFPETTGNERAWILAYLKTRKAWLDTHSDPVLRKQGYRPNFYLQLALTGDWRLDRASYDVHGVLVKNT